MPRIQRKVPPPLLLWAACIGSSRERIRKNHGAEVPRQENCLHVWWNLGIRDSYRKYQEIPTWDSRLFQTTHVESNVILEDTVSILSVGSQTKKSGLLVKTCKVIVKRLVNSPVYQCHSTPYKRYFQAISGCRFKSFGPVFEYFCFSQELKLRLAETQAWERESYDHVGWSETANLAEHVCCVYDWHCGWLCFWQWIFVNLPTLIKALRTHDALQDNHTCQRIISFPRGDILGNVNVESTNQIVFLHVYRHFL